MFTPPVLCMISTQCQGSGSKYLELQTTHVNNRTPDFCGFTDKKSWFPWIHTLFVTHADAQRVVQT